MTPADLILTNGKIYTDIMGGPNDSLSTAITWSQALSIREGNILSIGTTKAIEKERGPNTKVIDLKGKLALPGFNDADIRAMTGGLSLDRVDLTGVTHAFQLQDRLRSYATANPQKKWIHGQGWDQNLFPNRTPPTKADLDAVVSDRPVLLWSSDHHAAVLNSKAIETLKITSSTASPRNGEIQKTDTGEPTGLLLEEAAFDIGRKIDRPMHEELKQAFLGAQALAVRHGVTSIQGGPIRGEEEIKVVEELYKEKKLSVRYAMWGDLERPQEFLSLKNRYKHLPEEWVKFDAVKGSVDGVLNSRTAALTDPYSDDAHNRGEPLYTQEKLNELVLSANRLGLAVALHAVGDKAVGMAVTAIVSAKKQLFNSRIRNRVEHAELTPPFVYSKFYDFNIVASVQPSHLVAGSPADDTRAAKLGPLRSKNDFAWRNFIASKAHLAFGSEWPAKPLDPLLGIFAAVYRQHRNGLPAAGINPPQKLTLQQALEAYTLGSAYATREEHVKGSLREGKYADIVVLEKDPFKAKGRELLNIPAYLTITGGKIVHDGSVPLIGPAKP